MMRVHTVTVTSCYTVYALPPTNMATLTTLLYTGRLVKATATAKMAPLRSVSTRYQTGTMPRTWSISAST